MLGPLPAAAPATPLIEVGAHEKPAPPRLFVKAIEVAFPEQMVCEAGVAVITGFGFTVIVTVIGFPEQPAGSGLVGVMVYTAVPETLPVVVKLCAMLFPLPAVAPVILPLIVPIDQLKVLDMLAVRGIFVFVPLQILVVNGVVRTGTGFAVMIAVSVIPMQEPLIDRGVIIYSTVPGVVLLGLFSVCPIALPELSLAPVTPPVIEPTVQLKLLNAVEVKTILVDVPLQMFLVKTFVILGIGFTIIITVYGSIQTLDETGVTIYSRLPAVELLGLINT
jgi:hypothetical protein